MVLNALEQARLILERVSRYAVWAGGASLLMAAVMVTVDVMMRKAFSITMSGSDEITGYVFAASTTWAYSYCLLNRSNVRIDALYNFLPRPVRATLDVVGLALLLAYMTLLTDKAIDVMVTSFERDSVAITTLATPLWIPQLAWVSGLVLFEITMIVMLAYTLLCLVTGNFARVQNLAGAMSIEEEIEAETQGKGTGIKRTGGEH
jgi:TRAP-type C4-dicarboxylate transport system permease small subunit